MVAAIPVALKRTGAALFLAGFLTQAADGLMAALCPPSFAGDAPISVVESGGVFSGLDHTGHEEADSDLFQAGYAEGGDPGHSDHESSCPFGGAAIMACGGTPTAPAPGPTTRSPALVSFLLTVPEPATGLGTLLVSDMFRPPRG